jgi:rhodanese-related sulfurtransferase
MRVKRLRQLFWWLPFGRVAEVSAGELKQMLSGANPPQIIDVRTRTEWHKSRIPGARHVPIPAMRRRIDTLSLDTERPIVAICLSAHRSIPAVRLLQARGYPQAVQLQGGMLAWWKAAYPTETDGEAS